MRIKKLVLSLTLVFAASGLAQAAGNPEAGQEKSQVCAACHGADGNGGVNPLWPKLAGQQPSYTVRQLQAFQLGERTDPVMNPMVANLTWRDMVDLAAFYGTQPTTLAEEVDYKLFAKGERIFRVGIDMPGVSACISCHGSKGQGMPGDIFPSLRGQHREYLVKSLNDFRSGTRTTDPEGMMRIIAKEMSDQQIEAIAVYLSAMQ